FGRGEPPRLEIGIAEDRPEAGVVRRIRYRALGKVDRGCGVVRMEGHQRAGREADIVTRPAAETCLLVRSRAAREHRGESDGGTGRTALERPGHEYYPLRWALEARESISGMRPSIWSSASVTICCAERPSTAQARRSLR